MQNMVENHFLHLFLCKFCQNCVSSATRVEKMVNFVIMVARNEVAKMWSLSDKLTECYVKINDVQEEKIEIYRYGFKLIISDIINFAIILTLGVLIGSFLDSVCFLIVLVVVRRFSGGFHAKTFLVCRLSMIITYLCVQILSDLLGELSDFNLIISLVINIISLTVIVCHSPVENVNKPLNDRQRKINKRKAIIASLLCFALSQIMIIADIDEGVTISLTLAAVAILMPIGLAVKKRGENNV